MAATPTDACSPAGKVLDLIDDLLRQNRISRSEAAVIEALIVNPEFPNALRRLHPSP